MPSRYLNLKSRFSISGFPIEIPDFRWNDGQRRPETKPLEEQKEETRAQDIEMDPKTNKGQAGLHDFRNYYEVGSDMEDLLWFRGNRFRSGNPRPTGAKMGSMFSS